MQRSPVKPERLTLLYDGGCPICSREAASIERRDRGRGRLELLDITDESFDPSDYGLTEDEVMQRMHAITPEGEVITGMEAFRRAYRAMGRGWLLAPTGWPVLRPVFDLFYRWFARNRMRLTGRSCDDRCRGESARGTENRSET